MLTRERVEVGEVLLEKRRIPCVCWREDVPPNGYKTIGSVSRDGCGQPFRRIMCGDCGKRWTRIG
jgi:hypothetical protein